jgi:hypothetical protein
LSHSCSDKHSSCGTLPTAALLLALATIFPLSIAATSLL